MKARLLVAAVIVLALMAAFVQITPGKVGF